MLERESVVVGGRTIAYARAGQGPPLVLLHGIGGNASQWVHQLEGLSDGWDVVAWDAPGYGGSDDPGPDWGMADYADCLAGLLDTLGFGQVHLLGQSWGGVLAQEVHRRHGERLRSLVFSDTMAAGAQPMEDRQASLAARLRALDTMTPTEMARARTPALVGRDTPATALAEIEAMLAEIRPAGYRRSAIALAEADTLDTLGTIEAPALVIAGELDGIVPPALARDLHGRIPGAGWVLIPDAGHLAGQERPEQYNTIVRDFLSGVERATVSGRHDRVS
jgi:pimeloyl-ACP methyl ester carboxylesterase